MSHDGSILDLHTVEFKRLLPGPIELAWDYLTKPELLKTWFADVTLEPRVGGAIAIRFGDHACETDGVRGTIREFRKPHIIAFSWFQQRQQPDGSYQGSDEGEVRFELAEKGDKVLLTLLHSGLPIHELANHSAGWHAYLDNLEARTAGRDAIDVAKIFGDLHPSYSDRIAALQTKGAA
ncbi:SRPBCC family protein [Dongia deserti]|uniref:SRPBCC family protein n=1 Tax=Dongia deserti TaxID=2268030 RepID=UPI000E65B1B2|nr:SRPBCC family protein [Dongia deserti]